MSYHNLVEPVELVDTFLEESPVGFTCVPLPVGDQTLPCFHLRFDLGTTLSGWPKRLWRLVAPFIPKPRTLFVGTTVSEYALFPKSVSVDVLTHALRTMLGKRQFPILVVKDLPFQSPLLSAEDNRFAETLVERLRYSGFLMVAGEALAYVPIDFASIDDFLHRFSRTHRNDLKRKLRSLATLRVEEIETGDPRMTDTLIRDVYDLYLNVYEASYVHFDKLTLPFFASMLKSRSAGGILFLYRREGAILGFNLCFLKDGALIDKYIGFRYPDSYEANLYFVSWFYNLEFSLKRGLKVFIAGWTDPEVKAYLGATFTTTIHAVYVRPLFLRLLLRTGKSLFESDRHAMERLNPALKARSGSH